jgi:hypothetical protein
MYFVYLVRTILFIYFIVIIRLTKNLKLIFKQFSFVNIHYIKMNIYKTDRM